MAEPFDRVILGAIRVGSDADFVASEPAEHKSAAAIIVDRPARRWSSYRGGAGA